MVNVNKGFLMLGYGQLIHFLRDKEFVNEAGDYIDDDIDLWASLETFLNILSLESDLFSFHGWTIRAFIKESSGREYITFVQVVNSCSHNPSGNIAKADHIAIEVYPLAYMQVNNDEYLFKDLWQHMKFGVSLIAPPQCITFNSAGTSYPLHLQIPHGSFSILECLYGDWETPQPGKKLYVPKTCVADDEIQR